MTLALRYAVRSDVGLLREGNEDSAYAGPYLLAVADGMGGYEAGEVASASVISSVMPLDRTPTPEAKLVDALSAAVANAKLALRGIVESDPTVGSMGTTLTAMLWSDGAAAICHIGDSRAYLLRDGDFYQVTRDHTFVQALIDQGRIRPDEATTHPQRSLLLRALDGRTDADPDISVLTAQAGDRFLLCSDGLPVAVGDEEIMQALAEVKDPAEAVLKLIELAISGGGPDNITCIVADVIDTRQSSLKPTREPVLAGAAASGAGTVGHKTMPFARPVDGMDGLTQLGTLPDPHDLHPGTPLPPAGPSSGPQSNPRTRQGQALRAPDAAGAPDADEAVGLASGSGRPGRTPPGGLPVAGKAQPRRRRLPVMTAVLAAFILLIGGGLLLVHQYAQSQYYIGTQNGNVAIFRGINQKILGFSLSSPYRSTNVPLSGLPVQDKGTVNSSLSGSLAYVTGTVDRITRDYRGCQRAYSRLAAWQASRGRKITYRRHGHDYTRYVKPPRPRIPPMCPPQSAAS